MLTQVEKTKLRTWVELDRVAIKKNFQTFRKIIRKDCILMSVVKSNAYGHGLVLFSKEVVKAGANFLGVDAFEEALELRAAGIKTRIMVFGYTSPAYYKEAVEKNISITISNFPALEAALRIKFSKKLKIHIKADTGLGRQGFMPEDLSKVVKILQTTKTKNNIEVEGLYSHLAVGEDSGGREYSMLQAKRLNVWDEAFKHIGLKYLKHICASSSTMFFPELHYDMVRVGIGMYGLWPSNETKEAFEKKYTLYPVLSWKAIITETKMIKKGEKIGYALTHILARDSVLGIVPVGYWHGYPRMLSNKGGLEIKGKRAPILGRVCMDMIILDLTGIKAEIGDEVVIVGGKNTTADIMAEGSSTINYEIVTRINPEIRRF